MFEWHKKEKPLFTGSRFGFGGGGGGGSGVSVSYDATGGTKIASGDYNLHFFTATGPGTFSGTISNTSHSGNELEVFVVAGGGGGGTDNAGGGGAGGVRYRTFQNVKTFTATVSVGGGGAGGTGSAGGGGGASTPGGNSTWTSPYGNMFATGGGSGTMGEGPQPAAGTGGSGGGGNGEQAHNQLRSSCSIT